MKEVIKIDDKVTVNAPIFLTKLYSKKSEREFIALVCERSWKTIFITCDRQTIMEFLNVFAEDFVDLINSLDIGDKVPVEII